jgi:hypothetical protein
MTVSVLREDDHAPFVHAPPARRERDDVAMSGSLERGDRGARAGRPMNAICSCRKCR